MADTMMHLIIYAVGLVVFITLYRQIVGRSRTVASQAAEAFERYKKLEAMEENRLAISQETLTLQRETNDLLRRLLEKP